MNPEERTNLNLIRFSNRSGSHVGCFRASKNETDAHVYKKFETWLNLTRRGHSVITEAILTSNEGRIDVFDITEGVAYEILSSEKEKDCDLKSYPVPIIKIKC